MSSPVNPILVVKNNLPDYRDELIHERAKLQERINAIDTDVATLGRLEQALGIPVVIMGEAGLPAGWDRGPGA